METKTIKLTLLTGVSGNGRIREPFLVTVSIKGQQKTHRSSKHESEIK